MKARQNEVDCHTLDSDSDEEIGRPVDNFAGRREHAYGERNWTTIGE